MSEGWRLRTKGSNANAKVVVADRAARQFGRISALQLRALGVPRTTVAAWVGGAYLYPVLPTVYAVGHDGSSTEAELAAALLYAGPGAALSHGTAACWWRLLDRGPALVQVSTPRRRQSLPGVEVHDRRRNLTRVWRLDLPVTTVPQTLLDLAATATLDVVRSVLGAAEYRRLLDIEVVRGILGQGRPGSKALREALAGHEPKYAWTKSRLERAFLDLCRRHGIPLPKVNVRIDRWLVDAVWPERKVVIELDGYGNHRTRAQLNRDHQRDLELRAAGYIVVRYTETQIMDHPDEVAQDVMRLLGINLPVPSAARGSR